MSDHEPPQKRRGQAATLLVALVLAAVAWGLRARFIQRVGPMEGGGDEWWSVWRSWAVLHEGGLPGNYLHPALYYDLSAAWFWLLRHLRSGDQLADFVRHQYEYVRQLEYLSAACAAATVAVIVVLGARLFGVMAGVLAGLLVAVLPLSITYGQAARVDALFTLMCALFWLAFSTAESHGRLRDSAWTGLWLGLAISANYPGLLLAVPYVGWHLARRSWRGLILGGVVAVVAFVMTNPALLQAPQQMWVDFLFQAGMASHAHPGREGLGPDFYLSVLREQGLLLIGLSVIATIWFAIRGRGVIRWMALSAVLYLAAFALLRTQFDRYILPPLPWLCVLSAGLLSTFAQRGLALRVVAVGLGVLMAVQSARLARPRIAPDYQRTEPMPAEVAQSWLVEHATDGQIWVDSDLLPLMQAVFADPGGDLQKQLQAAFHQAYPTFGASLVKAEHIERTTNFGDLLAKFGRIPVVVSCGDINEADAFHEQLRLCPERLQFERCWIRDCR